MFQDKSLLCKSASLIFLTLSSNVVAQGSGPTFDRDASSAVAIAQVRSTGGSAGQIDIVIQAMALNNYLRSLSLPLPGNLRRPPRVNNPGMQISLPANVTLEAAEKALAVQEKALTRQANPDNVQSATANRDHWVTIKNSVRTRLNGFMGDRLNSSWADVKVLFTSLDDLEKFLAENSTSVRTLESNAGVREILDSSQHDSRILRWLGEWENGSYEENMIIKGVNVEYVYGWKNGSFKGVIDPATNTLKGTWWGTQDHDPSSKQVGGNAVFSISEEGTITAVYDFDTDRTRLGRDWGGSYHRVTEQ